MYDIDLSANMFSLSAFSDDVHSVLSDGMDFRKFCPDWQGAALWQQWIEYGKICFTKGSVIPCHHSSYSYYNLEDIHSVPPIGRSRMIRTHIPISFDEEGCPEIPTVINDDSYDAKAVQSMLRDYCTAHIRELSLYIITMMSDACDSGLGFLTGKKKQTIPWGSLKEDPSSWINVECYPEGFAWMDPSKMHKTQVFILLTHWTVREDDGHIPLIWVPTCPLFEDIKRPRKQVRTLRQRLQESDEEVFDLPASDNDTDMVGMESDGDSSEDGESLNLDMGSSEHVGSSDSPRSQDGTSGEHFLYIHCAISHLLYCATSEDSGQSAILHNRHGEWSETPSAGKHHVHISGYTYSS